MQIFSLRSVLWITFILFCCSPTLAQRPAFDPLLQRAENALAAKDLDKAVTLYEKLANFYPRSSLAHNRLGYAHYLRGNDSRAIYSFRKSLALSRRNDEALHNLLLASGRQADALARENAFSEAERVLEDLIASYSWHPQHAVLLYYRGRMEFLRGKPEAGLSWWKKASRRAPSSGVAKVIKAQSLPLNDTTVALYASASEQVKTEPAFNYLLGKRQFQAKQFQNAYDSFARGLNKSEDADVPFPLLSLKFAQAALKTGRTDEAIDALEAAKLQRPDWASLRFMLWPAYILAGQPSKADQALQESYELDNRPKLALLGSSLESVRLQTSNGSLLLIPPVATSLSPGTVTLKSEDGEVQTRTVERNQALTYRVSNGTLQEVSTEVLSDNTGNAGQLAPPLVAKTRQGRLYRLTESLLKKPIVLLFWHIEDEDSSNQLSELGAIASRFGDNVETVAIHTNSKLQKDAQRLYLRQPGTSAQLWGDLEVAQSFGLEEVPAVVVVDRNGRVTVTRYGYSSDMFNGIADYLESL